MYLLQLQPISILQVKEQIDNLKVKCENFDVGCGWKGLFKQLMVCVLPSYNDLSSTLHYSNTHKSVSMSLGNATLDVVNESR